MGSSGGGKKIHPSFPETLKSLGKEWQSMVVSDSREWSSRIASSLEFKLSALTFLHS